MKKILFIVTVLLLCTFCQAEGQTSGDFEMEGTVLKKYKGTAANVVIPEGVIETTGTCWGCPSLTSVVIPESVTDTEDSTFENYCPKLTIHSQKWTAAESYASENNIPSENISYVKVKTWHIVCFIVLISGIIAVWCWVYNKRRLGTD